MWTVNRAHIGRWLVGRRQVKEHPHTEAAGSEHGGINHIRAAGGADYVDAGAVEKGQVSCMDDSGDVGLATGAVYIRATTCVKGAYQLYVMHTVEVVHIAGVGINFRNCINCVISINRRNGSNYTNGSGHVTVFITAVCSRAVANAVKPRRLSARLFLALPTPDQGGHPACHPPSMPPTASICTAAVRSVPPRGPSSLGAFGLQQDGKTLAAQAVWSVSHRNGVVVKFLVVSMLIMIKLQ